MAGALLTELARSGKLPCSRPHREQKNSWRLCTVQSAHLAGYALIKGGSMARPRPRPRPSRPYLYGHGKVYRHGLPIAMS